VPGLRVRAQGPPVRQGALAVLTPGLSQRIERALRGLTHGSIQLVVHEAEVVRIERIERVRLTVTAEANSQQRGHPTDASEACHEPAEE